MKLICGNLRYSSWSVRALLAAKLSGLDVEVEVVPLFHADTRQLLNGRSPTNYLPLLLDDDTTIWDSLAIYEYLAEQASGLWPEDKKIRAVARSMCAEMHSGFSALRNHLPMNTARAVQAIPLTQDVISDVCRIAEIWQNARARYGDGGDFLCGAFGLVDCFFAPVASRFLTYDINLDPVAAAYVAAVRAHPLVKTWYGAASKETWIIDSQER